MQQAAHLAQRLEAEAGANIRNQVDLAWKLALCRMPSEQERTAALQFVDDEIRELRSQTEQVGTETDLQRTARIQLCRVLLNLNEFVYPN